MAARGLDECYRLVAVAINACASLPIAQIDPATVDADTPLLAKSFAEIGFDSLAYMEFCIAIQVETGLEISAATVAGMGSPDAVARYLSQTA